MHLKRKKFVFQLVNYNYMSNLAILGGKPVRNKLFSAYKYIGEEEKNAVLKVMDSGILSRYLGCKHEDFMGGEEVRSFEKEWAKYFNVKHAIAVNSCTSGLQCSVGAIGTNPGDEIIVSPYTMAASATAPLWYGVIPVFADIEEDYFCLDPNSIEKKITKNTKAIIVVDIFGQTYNVEAINSIAKKYNLIIIEDCAQAPYAKYKGKFAGTLGDIGVYSLNYHKHIHTGEGGMIVTNNYKYAEKIRLIRNHAEAVIEEKNKEELANMIGFNFRMTEIQAAIGREQLKKLKILVEERIKNCNYISRQIEKIPGIKKCKIRKDSIHAFYELAFLYDEKKIGISRNKFIDAVKAELPATELRETEGTQISYGYVKPLYLLPLFQKKIAFGNKGYPFNLYNYKNINYGKGLCPVAERMHEKELFTVGLMRPPALKKDLDDVIKAFNKVYKFKNELI